MMLTYFLAFTLKINQVYHTLNTDWLIDWSLIFSLAQQLFIEWWKPKCGSLVLTLNPVSATYVCGLRQDPLAKSTGSLESADLGS